MPILTFSGVFIAAVAATVALWQGFILRRQLKNDVFIRRATFHQSVANLLRDLDFLFFNNPEMRPYFYENKKPLDPLVEQQALSLAEYIMDLIECYTASEKADPILLTGDWDDYFNYIYKHSYAMRKYWNDFGHLYPPDVKRAVIGPSARPKSWPEHMKSSHEQEHLTGIPDAATRDALQQDLQQIAESRAPKPGSNVRYNRDDASSYQSVALRGSTFAVSLFPAISSMGDLAGMTALDFGTGTGRSARALKDSGASRVVGVDNNGNMLKAAPQYPAVTYLRIGETLPLKEKSIDVALCANVFSEFSKVEEIEFACRQVWKVLGTGKAFVVVVPNPDSFHFDYVSYKFLDVAKPESGTPISTLLKGGKPIIIQDYYWTADDYTRALESAGFYIEEFLLPTASDDGTQWLDETRVAPDLVIHAKRVG